MLLSVYKHSDTVFCIQALDIDWILINWSQEGNSILLYQLNKEERKVPMSGVCVWPWRFVWPWKLEAHWNWVIKWCPPSYRLGFFFFPSPHCDSVASLSCRWSDFRFFFTASRRTRKLVWWLGGWLASVFTFSTSSPSLSGRPEGSYKLLRLLEGSEVAASCRPSSFSISNWPGRLGKLIKPFEDCEVS